MKSTEFERFMDLTEGQNTLDVIIQMKASKSEEQMMRKLTEQTSKIERFRSTVVDPRELLPSSKKKLIAKSKQKRPQAMKSNQGSFAAQIANHGLKSHVFSQNNFEIASENFLGSDIVRRSAIEKQARVFKKYKNANSVQFSVSRDNLDKIVSEQKGAISGIFENKHIETPNVSNATEPSNGVGSSRYSSQSWGVHSSGASASWGTHGVRGQGVKVAVLDTGIDDSHPDLLGKVSEWAEFDASGNIVPGSTPFDSGTHGTHVAGTIAGGNDSGKWIGVAPDCQIMGGLVLNGGSGTVAQILAGMEWAIDEGADIINMSLGDLHFESDIPTPYRRQLISAIAQGTLVVAAIGNNGLNSTGLPGADMYSLGVGAHDAEFRCAGFSGGHVQRQGDSIYQKPDLSAPGVGIRSSVPGAQYSAYNGTSMAAPHVAGAAALLFSAINAHTIDPDQRAFLLRDLIEASVRPYGEMGKDQRYGYGLLDIHRAIDAAKELGY